MSCHKYMSEEPLDFGIMWNFMDKRKWRVSWPSLSLSCANPLLTSFPWNLMANLWLKGDTTANLQLPVVNPDLTKNSGGLACGFKSSYFWEYLHYSAATSRWGCHAVGILISFLRDKIQTRAFFSDCVSFLWLSGTCHVKTMAGMRWKTHQPTLANHSLKCWAAFLLHFETSH